MNEQTIALLEKLATKLGTTSEFLWGILVRQAMVEGVTDGVVALFFLAGNTILVWAYLKFMWVKRNKENPDDADINAFWTTVSISLVLSVIAINYALSSGKTLANPDYWAFQQVKNALK